jgi:hypothetical protein
VQQFGSEADETVKGLDNQEIAEGLGGRRPLEVVVNFVSEYPQNHMANWLARVNQGVVSGVPVTSSS